MESEYPYHEIPILVAEYNPEPVGFTVTILVILVHVRMRHSIEIVNPVPNALWYSPILRTPRYHRRILRPLRSFKIWAKFFRYHSR